MADHAPETGPASIVRLEQCVALVSTDVELMLDLARAYEGATRINEAEATYRRVLDLDPDYADAHVHLAVLLLSRGAIAEARQHAETALRLQPNRRAVLELLARASHAAEGSR